MNPSIILEAYKITNDKQNEYIKQLVDLGWVYIGESSRFRKTVDLNCSTNARFSYEWPHDSEPIIPNEIKPFIR